MKNHEKISAAVIGVGYVGQWHARKLAGLSGVDLVAVVDSDPDKAGRLSKELGCSAHQSVINLPDNVMAATVAVPTADHFTVAESLLDRGIDLLIEKPIARDMNEATRLVEMASGLGRILAVGHVERFNPAFLAAADSYESPFLIESRRLAPFKERARGVDVVRDLMIHDIDLICSMAGAEASVESAAGAAVITDKIDAARAHLKFENGLEAYLLASRVHVGEVREIEVFDESGCLHINCRDRTSCRFTPGENGTVEHPFKTVDSDPLEEELRDFIRAVRTGTKPSVTGEDGVRALKLVIDIVETIEGGR